MSKPITIPNVFQNQVGPIPLSQLDADFTTVAAATNDYQTYSNGVTDTGTTNSLVVTIVSPATFAYALFVALDVLISNTTTSAAPTINVNSLGAKTITLADGSSLPTGTLAAGGIYRLIYDGTNFRVMGSLPGNAFFANPTASVGLTAVNGSATTAMRSDAAPALSQAISPTWSGNHTFSNAITVNGAGSSLKGTVTATTPAAGTTLKVQGVVGNSAFTGSSPFSMTVGPAVSDSTNYYGIDFTDTAVPKVRIGANFGGSGSSLVFGTSNNYTTGITNSALTIGFNGNVTVAAPGSGCALTLTAVSAQPAINSSATAANFCIAQFAGNANTLGGTDTYVGQLGDSRAALFNRANADLILGSNNTTRVTVGAAGNVTIGAPSSGTALTVNAVGNGGVFNGAASNYALSAQTSALSSGTSFGLNVLAGTNSSDNTALFRSQAGATSMQVRGDGLVQAVDQGGTLQDVGWRGVPPNVQGTNYTLVLSDRGKSVQATATITVTVPNAVFSAGDVVTILVGNGATVTIAQGAGVTLQWAGNGATTGNRTLTGAGVSTVVFATSAVALISGAGLT